DHTTGNGPERWPTLQLQVMAALLNNVPTPRPRTLLKEGSGPIKETVGIIGLGSMGLASALAGLIEQRLLRRATSAILRKGRETQLKTSATRAVAFTSGSTLESTKRSICWNGWPQTRPMF